MPEEKKAKVKGTFWGTLIGAVLASLVASGALSSAVNWGTAERAAEGAQKAVKKDAEAQARAEAAKVEKAIAKYIKEQVEPRIVASFEDFDAELGDLDSELLSCQKDVREATIMADTALRLAERRVGSRAVAREMERTDSSEPKPAHKPRAKKLLPIFNDYQQQVQEPMAAEGG